jgi:hypothetical protein
MTGEIIPELVYERKFATDPVDAAVDGSRGEPALFSIAAASVDVIEAMRIEEHPRRIRRRYTMFLEVTGRLRGVPFELDNYNYIL